jgi:hypothetical protein
LKSGHLEVWEGYAKITLRWILGTLGMEEDETVTGLWPAAGFFISDAGSLVCVIREFIISGFEDLYREYILRLIPCTAHESQQYQTQKSRDRHQCKICRPACSGPTLLIHSHDIQITHRSLPREANRFWAQGLNIQNRQNVMQQMNGTGVHS